MLIITKENLQNTLEMSQSESNVISTFHPADAVYPSDSDSEYDSDSDSEYNSDPESEYDSGHKNKDNVEPHYLIMCFRECEYCGVKGHDKTIEITLGNNFGIICCKNYLKKAKQDILTFAKTNGLLRVHYNLLPTESFNIKTPSGEIDENWYFDIPNSETDCCYAQKDDNKWYMSLKKNGQLKSVKIIDLIDCNPDKVNILNDYITLLDDTLEDANCIMDLYLD